MSRPAATASVRARSARVDLRGVALGAAVAILVLVGDFTGVLGGWPLIVIGVFAALTVPASREASRRVLFVGCVALGWGPMMWWFPLAFPGLTHAGIVVAALLGVLTSLVVARRVPASSLVPRFRLSDVVTLAAAAFATWLLWPLFTVSDGETALRTLGLGWDYAAHFDMAELIRRLGSMVEIGSPGPFGQWSSAGYPKGFHAAVVTVMESTVGTAIASPEAELVGFLHATAALGVATVTIVSAGVVAMVRTRRKPLLAALLGALVVLALMLGPGGATLLRGGFPNFLLATALLGCIPLIAVSMDRVAFTAPLLALSGILVGIAHNWALLLVPGFAAVLAVLLPMRRRRWPSATRGWVGLMFVVLATLLAGIAAWWTVRQGAVADDLTSQLLVDGGFTGGSRTEIILPAIVAIGACATVGWITLRRARDPIDGEAVRTAAGSMLPLAGLGLLGYVAFVQLTGNGELGYYFYKLGTAVQLSSVVLVAVAIPVLLRLARGVRRRRILLVGTGLGLAVLLATSSGTFNPTSEGLSLRRPPGFDARIAWTAESEEATSSSSIRVGEVLDAAAAVSDDDRPYYWVPGELDGTTLPQLENQWLFALTGRWSVGSYEVVNELWGGAVLLDERPRDTAEAVARLLEAAPDSVIIVPPEVLERLGDDPEFMGRLISF